MAFYMTLDGLVTIFHDIHPRKDRDKEQNKGLHLIYSTEKDSRKYFIWF